MKRFSRFIAPALLSGSVLVAGCDREEVLQGRIDRTVGESTISRAVALIVPPSYSLRPGDSDVGRSGSIVDRSDETGIDLGTLDTTAGESGLLQRAGAEAADPGIRDTLARENAILAGDPELVETLLFGDFPASPPTPEVIEEVPEGEDVTGAPEETSGDEGGFWDWF